MKKTIKQNGKGFTLLELVVSISIAGIMCAGVAPLYGDFSHRRGLEASMNNLVVDLMQTQQFSRTQRDGKKYYAIRFYDNLGPKSDRCGYKILCFDGNPPIEEGDAFTVVKSPDENDDPEFLEDTFFGPRATFYDQSEIKENDMIVFTPEGSATMNGVVLLSTTYDEIIMTVDGQGAKVIRIAALTGQTKIDDFSP